MAPEAVAFAAIGLGNLVLFFLIFNVLIFIGAVKATVIATLVTTYLAYLANRHWTYKDRPRRAVRREYTLSIGSRSTSRARSASASPPCSGSGPTAPSSSRTRR